MNKFIHSRFIRWLLLSGLFFMLILFFLRLVFWIQFCPSTEKAGSFSAFWLGFRYDLRVVCIFLLIILCAGILFNSKKSDNKNFNNSILIISRFFGLLIIVIYTFDFGHFAYLRERLNANVLTYTKDLQISAKMIWQSYPVMIILTGWLISFTCMYYATRFIYKKSNASIQKPSKKNVTFSYTFCFIFFAVAIFGRLNQFPLRWSDAYRLNSDFKAKLALNPFQTFISSLKFRKAIFNIQKTKEYYGVISPLLGISKPDSSALNFQRTSIINDSFHNINIHPNIVLVICESFSAYKSSMWGNPLQTTPFFNEICKDGIFFKNCFSPAYGTARGIWAIITGIPDVTEIKTASRDPNLVDQHTILNDIKGYSKYFFIGGSASWANIRGVLENNIKELKLYEQGDYKASVADVWGISDKNLFIESDKILKNQKKPFFAIIQTADNHRPYTIPAEDRPLVKKRELPADTLEKYGFTSNKELNAYSYMDYTFKVFFDLFSKEDYFKNTIFVFVGDHGIRGNAGNMMPKVWTEENLTTYHVPLLFYAPSLLKPDVVERKVSQIDIMPSIAFLANMEVENTTLGKNVFSNLNFTDSNDLRNHAFIIDPFKNLIGLITEKYYYQYNLETNQDAVYSLQNSNLLRSGEIRKDKLDSLQRVTLGYYETSRYMLYHNKKEKK